MHEWGFGKWQRRVGSSRCFLSVLINTIGPESPRKRRRTNGPSPVEDKEVFPQVDDVDPQQANMDIGAGGYRRTEISI